MLDRKALVFLIPLFLLACGEDPSSDYIIQVDDHFAPSPHQDQKREGDFDQLAFAQKCIGDDGNTYVLASEALELEAFQKQGEWFVRSSLWTNPQTGEEIFSVTLFDHHSKIISGQAIRNHITVVNFRFDRELKQAEFSHSEKSFLFLDHCISISQIQNKGD